MKNVSTFYIAVFLMIALTFGTPFVSYAQQVPEGAEKTTTSEQEANTKFEKLIATAKVVAERDAKVDFGNNQKILWFSTGFGCSVLGVAAAYLWEAQPPPTRLLGKSPEYVEVYGYTLSERITEKTSDVCWKRGVLCP